MILTGCVRVGVYVCIKWVMKMAENRRREELTQEIEALRRHVGELEDAGGSCGSQSEIELALRERVKELNCLYQISRIVDKCGNSLESLFSGVVSILPGSWLHPRAACARIVFDGEEHTTANFEESSWVIAADILIHGARAGLVEVRYLENRPVLDEGPFLQEERSLINAVAQRLGRDVERIQAHERAVAAEIALRERLKELDCLYTISTLQELHFHSSERFLQSVVDCLPGSWQFPEHACARIVYGDREYVTEGFRESRWRMGADVTADGKPAGVVEVFYRKVIPTAAEGPFLKEEYALVRAVAERVGGVLMHMKAQADLRAAHRAIQTERQALHEANVALRAVLARLEEEKREIRASILANIQKIIMPVVFELELEVTGRQRSYVTLLRQTLQEIASPFLTQMSRNHMQLTPVEIAISTMIRNGLSTKEIAQLRCISPATVRRHRENIRRKLGLKNRKVNLVTYLQASSSEEPRPSPENLPGLSSAPEAL